MGGVTLRHVIRDDAIDDPARYRGTPKVYAAGCQELTGRSADVIEVLNLDERGRTTRERVDNP
jgi:hypothetical protein